MQVFGDALCRMLFAFFAIPMYVSTLLRCTGNLRVRSDDCPLYRDVPVVYVSTLMILFIAVDRYRRVVWRQSLSEPAATALVVGSVLASTAFGVPVVAG